MLRDPGMERTTTQNSSGKKSYALKMSTQEPRRLEAASDENYSFIACA